MVCNDILLVSKYSESGAHTRGPQDLLWSIGLGSRLLDLGDGSEKKNVA